MNVSQVFLISHLHLTHLKGCQITTLASPLFSPRPGQVISQMGNIWCEFQETPAPFGQLESKLEIRSTWDLLTNSLWDRIRFVVSVKGSVGRPGCWLLPAACLLVAGCWLLAALTQVGDGRSLGF